MGLLASSHYESVSTPDKSPCLVFRCRCPPPGPCSYIRYQDIPNLPSNFIAVGDSMLQLNPIYASVTMLLPTLSLRADLALMCRQGCSKAMMGAITLNSLLAQTSPAATAYARDVMPEHFARTYFSHVGNHGDALWCVQPRVQPFAADMSTCLTRESTKTFGKPR